MEEISSKRTGMLLGLCKLMVRISMIVCFEFFLIVQAFSNPVSDFDKNALPFLSDHCLNCHNEKKQKGDFRIDNLSKEIGLNDTALWVEVMERISSGEMPPEGEELQPTAGARLEIVQWLSDRVEEGKKQRMAKRDRVSYLRLTRDEYVNTLKDLLGVIYDAKDPGGLLEDPQWQGFERIGSVLTLSPTHIEKYIKAAEIILDEAYPSKSVLYQEASKRAIEIREGQPYYDWLKERSLLEKVRAPITTSGEIYRYNNPWKGEQKFPGPGLYEISYVVSGLKPENGIAPRMRIVEADLDRVLFERDIVATEEEPVTITFQAHFANPTGRPPKIYVTNQNKVRRHPRTNAGSRIPFINTSYSRAPWQMKITDESGKPRYPILIIDSLSMRGPILTDIEKMRRTEFLPANENILGAATGLENLAKRAFRRPLLDGEINPYLDIVKNELSAGESFKDAMKAGMISILCSKSFLFLAEGEQDRDRHFLNDWEIASRLSYLLWNTMPDDELFELAEKNELKKRNVLKNQLHRMLKDSRSGRFASSFSTQWLQLQKVGMFPPDRKLYPNYDIHLEQSMIGETQAFFEHVLQKNLSLREFIYSDWTMVNPKLAKFYGLEEIFEDRFQKVTLRPRDNRGGILTHASVLSLTSDGTRHRPVHRGVWLSESIFGKHPPPPPANVDPIEPNPVDSPKATLRMKLEAHKHDPNCASCHRKIDPLGLAFDHYNAIGEWRTHEKVNGTGNDPKVNASGSLPDGRTFENAVELKKILLQDMDTFNRTFVKKLATYGLRRTITVDDFIDIEAIAKIGKTKDYKLRDILEAFVLSELFQKR